MPRCGSTYAVRICEIERGRIGGGAMTMAPKKAVSTRRLRGEELCESPEALCRARLFLERYAVAIRMLRLCRIEKKEDQNAPGGEVFYGRVGGTEEYWKKQIREIRTFIDSLPNESCKLLLYYHYVVGMTVERASEELDISRRGAFRLKKKALAMAAARLPNFLLSQVGRLPNQPSP